MEDEGASSDEFEMIFGAVRQLRREKAVRVPHVVSTYFGVVRVVKMHVLYMFKTFTSWARFVGDAACCAVAHGIETTKNQSTFDDALSDVNVSLPEAAVSATTAVEATAAAAAEVRPVHTIIKEAAGHVATLQLEPDVAQRRRALARMSIEQRFVVLTRLEKVQPGAVRALASVESWAAFDAAATLTEELAVLKTLPGIERCAVYLAVSTAMRHELTLSTMAADLLRSLLEYRGEMLKLVRDGDDATTLEDHGVGYRLRTRSFRLRTGLGLGLALARKPTITLDNVAAKGAAEKRSAGDAAAAASATAKAATATTLAHGERLKINCDAIGAFVMKATLTAFGSIESKAQVTSLLKLVLTDDFVVIREGSTLMLRRRKMAPVASSPEPPPPPPLIGPTPARPLEATSAAERALLLPLPPAGHDVTAAKRKVPADESPANSSRPRRSGGVMDVYQTDFLSEGTRVAD
ncbi:hypothetical protein M885DRAFT_626188 [Pelagophyceae sp. CCMP2097]|nr:hypothetical protein M885DRAFT_626188 [Pelagophyceae sp. CCMP2097]